MHLNDLKDIYKNSTLQYYKKQAKSYRKILPKLKKIEKDFKSKDNVNANVNANGDERKNEVKNENKNENHGQDDENKNF